MSSLDTLFSQRVRDGLSKASPEPLYYQLYSLLKGMILDGTLGKGERMPTEEQLAETFKVSRITAKRAMDELAAESLVERRRGKGTHIIYEYSPKPVKAPLVGMLQEIESMARNTEFPAPPELGGNWDDLHNREIIAMIAYLLRLGTDLQPQPEETTNVAAQ